MATSTIKMLSVLTILILIANILLFSFRIISSLLFWMIIVACAIIAFPVMNMMRDKSSKRRAR